MATVTMSHAAHAMETASAGFDTRATPDTSHRHCVASADVSGAFAMNTTALAVDAGAFAMSAGALAMSAGALAMDGLSILRMRRRLTRPVSRAYDITEFEPIIARNLAPAFPTLVQRDNVVETLAGGI
jgi:hypothetical protein